MQDRFLRPHFRLRPRAYSLMTDQNFDGLFDGEWEERSDLAWSEADWERYLAEREKAVAEYLAAYDALGSAPDRIDQVARQLGWETSTAGETEDSDESLPEAEETGDDWDPYTVHRNPVWVSTRALYASTLARWEQTTRDSRGLPAPVAIGLQGSLHRGEAHALHGIHALEMGDYTLAICFFKRALKELNASLASVTALGDRPELLGFRAYALPRLFDLREIWLRVMNECRTEATTDDPD